MVLLRITLFVFSLFALGSVATLFARADDTIQTKSIPDTMTFTWSDQTRSISAETIASWFHMSATVRRIPGQHSEAISPKFCEWPLQFCSFALDEQIRSSLTNVSTFSLDTNALTAFLTSLQKETRVPAVDARFSADETINRVTVFSPSRDGNEIDVEKSAAIIRRVFTEDISSDPVQLATKNIAPKITSTDADRLGIVNFLGEGRTNFTGSPKNRIYNITRALEQFQGILIAPGEEFSFVKFLGEVDGEHGYLPELVIKRGQTLPEFGGGICQVSTTMFRAALNTGMKITARRNHAYPVSYYKPYGMDATIYIPSPDFRFVNNTPAHILIQGAIENRELVFRFYGTSDGRSVAIDGPHITERNPDGSMKTIFNQKVTDKDGHVIINDDFRSSYESPSKYPHPGEQTFTKKPKDWSEKQWVAYQQTH